MQVRGPGGRESPARRTGSTRLARHRSRRQPPTTRSARPARRPAPPAPPTSPPASPPLRQVADHQPGASAISTPGGHVPGVQPPLVVRVEAPARRTSTDRARRRRRAGCRARAAAPARRRRPGARAPRRRSRTRSRPSRSRAFGAAVGSDRLAVQRRLARPRRGEALLADRVEHDAGERAGRVLARDADRERRDPEQEVDRPVERVDDPAQLARRRSRRPPPPGSRRRGRRRAEHLPDRALGREVGLGHQVGRAALACARPRARSPKRARQLGRRRLAPPRARPRAAPAHRSRHPPGSIGCSRAPAIIRPECGRPRRRRRWPRSPGAAPGTDAERRAARWLAGELVAAGHARPDRAVLVPPELGARARLARRARARRQPRLGRRRRSSAARSCWSRCVSIVADALTGVSLGRRLTPERASQNVVASTSRRPATTTESRVRLIITANYDAGRAGLDLSRRAPRAVARRRRRADRRHRPGLARLAGDRDRLRCWRSRSSASQRRTTREPLGALQLPPTVALVLALALLLELASAGSVPAAGDNGSGSPPRSRSPARSTRRPRAT